ncbi:MAG: Asp-tRNA(Asn)/Glu-tRNA(Gln) amidotransferase subunit GatC [Ferruginibacter sp.]
MEVDDKLIEKLARLSRLHFSEEEKPVIKADLQKMIGFIEKLAEVDTTGVLPLTHMSVQTSVVREDEVQAGLTQEEALQNAPDSAEGFFRVPRVIKK